MIDTSTTGSTERPEPAPTEAEKPYVNIAPAERFLSTMGGGALTIFGLARGIGRRSPLGFLAAAAGSALLYRGVTGHCPAYQAAGVSTARESSSVTLRETVTVARQRSELYAAWRDFASLPRFSQHLESVQVLDERRSRWQARLPAGIAFGWEAEITEERPEELVSWRSLPGSEVEASGTVRFVDAPGGRGTEMHVHLELHPPAGAAGSLVAGLTAPVLSQLLREEIRRFKNLMETEEIPTAAGQPAGR